MADKEELLSETVRRYPVLHDQSHHNFKDKNKKRVASDDVAKMVDSRLVF